MLRLVSLVVLLAALVAGCGGGSDEPEVAARTVVLTREDVPDGFVRNEQQSRAVSNEEVAASRPEGYADQLERWGRLEGYSTQFTRDDVVLGPLRAAQSIDSVASVYEDADGATESFEAGVGDYPRSGFRPAGTIRVGDGGRAFRGSVTLNGQDVEYVVVTWRHGRVIANVVTSGRPRDVQVAAVEALARDQDRRIAAALDG